MAQEKVVTGMVQNPVLYRKFFVVLISATATKVFAKFGLETNMDQLNDLFGADMAQFGSEWLITIFIPGWLSMVWPNNPDAGILDYWRVAASGVAVAVAAAALLWWLR